MQPPQNPYSGFPGPNDPLPPQGGNTPPGGYPPGSTPPGGPPPGGPSYPPYSGGGPSGTPEISFDAISRAWTVFSSAMGTYIGAAAIVLVISFVFNFIQQGMQTTDSRGMPQYTAMSVLVGIIAGLINQFLSGGMMRMAINHLKSGTANFSDLFSVGDVFLNLILAGILSFIALLLGFCACVIPGLLLSGLFMFVTPLVVDRREGAIEAIGTSFNTLKPQMWMALVFVIVVGLLVFAGVCACGVGLLFTVPLGVLSIAVTYHNFFNSGQTPNFGTPNGPVAPIADPFR